VIAGFMKVAMIPGKPLADTSPHAPAGVEREPTPVRYVGDVGFSLGAIFGHRVEDNPDHWFEGADVYYVHTARTAIQRACPLLKLGDGAEVLVPAYSCGSEVDALLQGGAAVRFFRVSRSAEIDLNDLRRRITAATKAVYVIHYFGFSQPLAEISDLCKTKGLPLIEDCALSTFTEVDGRRIGQIGDIAVYNFPKILPVPDGGALVINSPGLRGKEWRLEAPQLSGFLANASRLARQGVLRALPNAGARFLDGLIRSTTAEELAPAPGRRPLPGDYYCHSSLLDRSISGFSARLMKRVDISEVRARRRRNFSHLLDLLSGLPGIVPLYSALPDGVCPLAFPILVGPARKIAFRLSSASIPALPWWSGYNTKCREWDAFPDACYLKDHVVTLPVHHQLSESAIQFIASRLIECLR
jgi:perosamine synthetase